MSKSITGFNAAATKGRNAAILYCQHWQNEIRMESTLLAENFVNRKIKSIEYNNKRVELNKRTKDLNECIKMLDRQFG